MKRTDTDGLECLNCGTGFKTFEERMKNAERAVQVINAFYNEFGRVPTGKEFDERFGSKQPDGELTYEMEGVYAE